MCGLVQSIHRPRRAAAAQERHERSGPVVTFDIRAFKRSGVNVEPERRTAKHFADEEFQDVRLEERLIKPVAPHGPFGCDGKEQGSSVKLTFKEPVCFARGALAVGSKAGKWAM